MNWTKLPVAATLAATLIASPATAYAVPVPTTDEVLAIMAELTDPNIPAANKGKVIVAAFVVAISGFGVYRLHGIFGSTDVVSWPRADSIENSKYNPKQVLLEVFGSPGAVATINYLDEHAQPQRVDNTTLPWSHLLTTTDPTLFADLRAQGDADPLTCRI